MLAVLFARNCSSQARRSCSLTPHYFLARELMIVQVLLLRRTPRRLGAPSLASSQARVFVPRVRRSRRFAPRAPAPCHLTLACSLRPLALAPAFGLRALSRPPQASLADIAWSSAPEKPPCKRFALGAFPEASLPACSPGFVICPVLFHLNSFLN